MKISLHQTEQPSAFLSTFVYASFLHQVWLAVVVFGIPSKGHKMILQTRS